jgi:hypothetical protein
MESPHGTPIGTPLFPSNIRYMTPQDERPIILCTL